LISLIKPKHSGVSLESRINGIGVLLSLENKGGAIRVMSLIVITVSTVSLEFMVAMAPVFSKVASQSPGISKLGSLGMAWYFLT
jgi:hypothetical protein